MLVELTVRGLGVVEHAQLLLGPGLTALTGETGAGKSLVVGAIGLLLGGRADGAVVRAGATEAVVDGRFVTHDGDEVVLSRVVPAEGRSRAYADGRPVTVHDLAERAAGLVELHGQHAHQQLLRAPDQRHALDRFAGVDLGPLLDSRRRITQVDAALAQLGGDERTRAREMDLLRYQLAELDAAGLGDPDEDALLDAEEDLLADAVAHRDVAAQTGEVLTGEGGAVDAVSSAVGALRGRAPFTELVDRLAATQAELGDVAAALRQVADGISDDPERLDHVRSRRQLLAELRRKYGETLADVLAEQAAIRSRLAELEGHTARVEQLQAERAAAEADEAAAASVVAAARRGAAPALADGVERRLRELAMPAARVEVAVDGPGPADDVRILLAANPGGDPLPMAKVASGGELSRATLALRLELTAGPPSLVFDEVDAGIGGEAALAVGAALADLSRRHQILVVTHLAQVAAFADQQLGVRKAVSAGSTTATVERLDGADRREELARMLSGQPESASGREHAQELLELAASGRLH